MAGIIFPFPYYRTFFQRFFSIPPFPDIPVIWKDITRKNCPRKICGGIIVCMHGFTVTTVGPSKLHELTQELHVKVQVVEIDESGIFCEIVK